jgi:hypothetical protein
MSDLTTLTGRELDEAVAIALGDISYDYVIDGTSRCGKTFATREEAAADMPRNEAKGWTCGPVLLHDHVPRYHDDIAAAWAVVELMMREHGCCYTISARPLHGSADGNAAQVVAEFFRGQSVKGFAIADTAPLAICRAFTTAAP